MNKLNEIEILLVEDNPNDAEMTIRGLNKHKLANNVIHVSDGEEALDFIYARGTFIGRNPDIKPRMILLDIKLPKINGLEVLKIIKSDPETKMIPVVVLTTSSEERDMIESYKYGVNSYIIKPVDFEKFAESIRNIGFYWLLLNKIPGK
jgi:two-component system, response regulator